MSDIALSLLGSISDIKFSDIFFQRTDQPYPMNWNMDTISN